MSDHSKILIKATATVGIFTLISRILGFIREVLIARLFGASLIADTYFVALRIPNLLRSVFAEGALTSAFVPVLADRLKVNLDEAKKVYCSTATLLLIVTILVVFFGIIYARELVLFIAPGFLATPKRFELCVELTQIMLPYIIFVSFIALINGALNSVKIFGVSALAQVIMNLVLIVGAFIAGYYENITSAKILAWSVVVGGIAQVLAQLRAIKRAGFPIMFLANPFNKNTLLIVKLIIPAILGATVYQLTIFINTQLASELETGSVAWISYADRLAQLPIGVFTIALSSVLLPSLSLSLASDDKTNYSKSLVDALRFTSFVIIPVSAILIYYGEQFIILIYQKGAFDQYATINTASVLSAYALGLFSISCHSLLIRAMQAKKDTVTPTVIGMITLVLTLVFSLLFIGKPYNYNPNTFSVSTLQETLFFTLDYIIPQFVVSKIKAISLGATGLALSSSLAMTFSMLISFILISKRDTFINWKPFLKSVFEVLLATVIGMIVAYFLNFTFISILLFLVIFCLILLLINNQEIQETFRLISRYISMCRQKS